MLVLEGRGAEYETDVPFGILVDALDEHLNGLDPAQLARAVGDAGDDLASVFPSLQRQAEQGGSARTGRSRDCSSGCRPGAARC